VVTGAAKGQQASISVFRGCFEHTLDGKGRVSLPAPFRQALTEDKNPSVILTNFICDGARCVDGFSQVSWSEFETNLQNRSRFDPQLRKLENYYLARAVECPVDSNGRINIPQHLRTYAGLEREVIFTASLRGFRVWDRRVWELIFSDAEAALLEDPALFMDVDK
jgi:MraZ protein